MKAKGKFYSLFISLVLLMGMIGSSVSAAGPSTGYEGELSDPYKGEQSELSEEQLEMVELSKEHIKASADSNGNIKLEIVNIEAFEQKVKETGYPLDMSGIQNIVDEYNEYLTSTSKNTIDESKLAQVPTGGEGTFAQVPIGGGGGTVEVDTSGMSCSDALTIIGLVHAGSYTYAAFLLGLTAGSSAAIPVIVGAAYGIASLLCD